MIIWINAFAASWAEYFGWAVIQNTIFLGIIMLLFRILSDAPARIRYDIGLAGLVKLIIPPFLAAPFLKPSPAILSSMTLIGIQPVLVSSENLPPPPPPPLLSLSGILFIAWTALLFVFLTWPILASLRMRRQLSNAIPVDHQPAEGIRILKTDRINVPLTFGLFRESIYVPAMWDEWSDDTRRMILSHEIAHIRRRDGLGRIFQILIQAIYFFHPMVWYVSRKMNEYREMACDDLSTHNEKTLSVEYSRALVQIAERLVRSAVDCPSASALIRQKNELLNRVQYQMEDTMKTISKKRTAFILAGLLVLTVPLSWMRAKPMQDDSPPPPPVEQKTETDWMSFPEGGFEAIQKNLVYPEAARKAGLEGKVIVEVLYNEKGFKSASIKESTFPAGKDLCCHQAAVDAVKSVNWSKIKNAEEAGGHVYVPIEFRLSPSTPAFGKIYGKVTDTNGNILPATNVTLLGTEIGAATDQAGNFYIINVPPGVYTLQASRIGFKSVQVQDVRVAVNKSKEVNIQLAEGVVDLTPGNPSKGKDVAALPPPSTDDRVTFVPYDIPPEPIGGFEAIQKNLVYPELARKAGIEGRVIVYIQVDENGDVGDTRIVHSLGENNGCDEAAVAAVRSVKWKPAMQRDLPVKVWVAVPIDFKLQEKTQNVSAPPLPAVEGVTFVPYDSPPEPIGGFQEIQKNLVYPEAAKNAGVEGRVILWVQVDKNGETEDVKVQQSLGPTGCDEAAIQAVKAVKWKPAMQRDQQVTVWIAVPVDFTLNTPENIEKYKQRLIQQLELLKASEPLSEDEVAKKEQLETLLKKLEVQKPTE